MKNIKIFVKYKDNIKKGTRQQNKKPCAQCFKLKLFFYYSQKLYIKGKKDVKIK